MLSFTQRYWSFFCTQWHLQFKFIMISLQNVRFVCYFFLRMLHLLKLFQCSFWETYLNFPDVNCLCTHTHTNTHIINIHNIIFRIYLTSLRCQLLQVPSGQGQVFPSISLLYMQFFFLHRGYTTITFYTEMFLF